MQTPNWEKENAANTENHIGYILAESFILFLAPKQIIPLFYCVRLKKISYEWTI